MTSTVLCGRGGSGRSFFTAGNGAELVSCASHSGNEFILSRSCSLTRMALN